MSFGMTTLRREPTLRLGDLTNGDLERLRSGYVVACDIETSGLDFRTDHIGTVQLADEQGNSWLIQIRPGYRPDALSFLLSDASTRKIFHFAPFDLAFMRFHWDIRAQNVACTKVLSRLVTPGAVTHSLKDVLDRELGVSLPKDEAVRRSDWDAKKLSAEQLAYAVSDVAHLIDLYDVLMEKATRRGVSRLAEQSFDYLPARVETELLGLADIFAY